MEELNLDFRSRPNELLSLQDLSITAAASLIWNTKEMKMAIEEVFDRHNPFLGHNNEPLKLEKSCLEELSVKISETVSHIFNQISLPQVLKTGVEKKLLEIVEEVIDWILYLIRDLKLDYKAVERIYWTTDGRIDEDKIFRFFRSERPVKWENFDQNLSSLHYLACFFGQEEFISLHRSDYIKALKPLEMNNNDTLLTIMKTVIYYIHDLCVGISNNLERLKFHIVNISTVEMLKICKSFCFYKAFQFFWNRLDATERFNYLETQSNTWSFRRNVGTIYGKNQIILFLMEQMDERQKYYFIVNNFSEMIVTFSRDKSCKKFCMPLVQHFLSIIDDTEKNNLVWLCADICNRSIQFDIELEIVHRLLKNVPINKPHFHLKFSFPVLVDKTSQILYTFFENFNLPALKFIIKNESSESRKEDLISIGEMKYKELIRNNNFQLMDKFLDAVLPSKMDKDKFKQNYNFLEEWVAECRFDIVDNVLIWMHGAASQDIKISFVNLFCSSIPKHYEAMEKLLIWFFDAQGPLINNCQCELELLNKVCSGLIYNLWFPKNYSIQNRVMAVDISTKILMFFFLSEREIENFKTKVLANEERFINFFCEKEWNNWKCHQLQSDLYDFLNFCNLPKEKNCYTRNILHEEWRKWALERSKSSS